MGEAAHITATSQEGDIADYDLDLICLIMAGQNREVKVYRGVRITTDFAVRFEHFNYSTLVEARRLGLD